jgi:hypothetical protein
MPFFLLFLMQILCRSMTGIMSKALDNILQHALAVRQINEVRQVSRTHSRLMPSSGAHLVHLLFTLMLLALL